MKVIFLILFIILILLVLIAVLILTPWHISGRALPCSGEEDFSFEARGRVRSFFSSVKVVISYESSLVFKVYILWFIPVYIKTIDFSSDKTSDSEDRKEEKKKGDNKFLSFIKKIPDMTTGVRKLLSMIKELLLKMDINMDGTDITYGLEDPALTGIVTGILMQFPFLLSKRVSLSPDFTGDRNYINGQIELNGRIIPLWVIKLFISVFNDKDIRKLFKKGKKTEGVK